VGIEKRADDNRSWVYWEIGNSEKLFIVLSLEAIAARTRASERAQQLALPVLKF
jgi:hypothetical protein